MNACNDVINIYAVKNIEEHLNFFENELIAQEKSDLVITTGLTGYGCEGLLPSISNLTKGRFVGVYYNELGAIYERLMQFILIMERGLVETAYPEQIGRIIYLMKRMKYRGLFYDVYTSLIRRNEDIGYHLVCECMRRYYWSITEGEPWKRPLQLIKNKQTMRVVLDFWLKSLTAVLDLKAKEWTELFEYDYMKSGQVTNDILRWPNITAQIIKNIVALAPKLIHQGNLSSIEHLAVFKTSCQMLLRACQTPIVTTNAIEIIDILFRWRRQQKENIKAATVSIVTWGHDQIIYKMLNSLGYTDECIYKYDVEYTTPEKGESVFSRILLL